VSAAEMFRVPFNMIFYSQSSGGKTSLMLDMINKPKLFDKPFDEIIYVYSIFNPRFKDYPQVKFVKNQIPEFKNDGKQKLLVCDDVITNKEIMNRLVHMFMIEAHHKSITCALLLQNLHFNKAMRSISLNCHVFVIFSHLRDNVTINTLFSQIALPTRFLKAAYKRATRRSYGYLVVNLIGGMSEELRVSTNICNKFIRFFVEKELDTPFPVTFNE
jgi:hypothetical protein